MTLRHRLKSIEKALHDRKTESTECLLTDEECLCFESPLLQGHSGVLQGELVATMLRQGCSPEEIRSALRVGLPAIGHRNRPPIVILDLDDPQPVSEKEITAFLRLVKKRFNT